MIRKTVAAFAIAAAALAGTGVLTGCDPSKPAPVSSAGSVVQLSATPTAFTAGVLDDGSAYTSVLVTVTNNSKDKVVSVNPLYFSITDTAGNKHTAELGVEQNEIAMVDLQPGEKVTGAVAAKGTFTAKTVVFDNMTDQVRAEVS
ncbi:DUF4352 domain-containing protein [Nocardia yunnanensis]|uniref:DUF4352 domain-containing protein n=1 Tax=Nocardia yunnanensis TaxID=2382165 RepID=A0A386ZK50_9NOCA|nr:DUF4352 domain-containing protein [Nocardia yunnanensis]AYF77798.1 DUF4352 domain-containing protein [Nocardia yunnanensis]